MHTGARKITQRRYTDVADFSGREREARVRREGGGGRKGGEEERGTI